VRETQQGKRASQFVQGEVVESARTNLQESAIDAQRCLRARPLPGALRYVIVLPIACCFSTLAWSQQQPFAGPPEQSIAASSSGGDAGDSRSLGTVNGTVLDQNGNLVPATQVTLTALSDGAKRESVPDSAGHFVFAGVPAGAFKITVIAPGFAGVARAISLHAGESVDIPDIRLSVGLFVSEVRVTETAQELAEEQIHVEEKQRVLGAIPNFYVSYDHNALPLTSRQKFELAWKTSLDPVNFLATGVIAGIEQASNSFSGFGQGTAGYAKRYAASYGDGLIGGYISNAILPSLLRQDPRYFYKGEGTIGSRAEYAIAMAVMCKGDNGHWQVNYSGIGGGLAAGAVSNLYYPAANRDGVGLTFENGLIGIGSGAIANLFQEFLVRKLTPHTHDPRPVQP
jgi:hypothetical protein